MKLNMFGHLMVPADSNNIFEAILNIHVDTFAEAATVSTQHSPLCFLLVF